MGTTQDTVYLTQIQLEDLLQTLHKKNAPVNLGGPADFKPVGRIEYDKRKYRDVFASATCAGRLEIL